MSSYNCSQSSHDVDFSHCRNTWYWAAHLPLCENQNSLNAVNFHKPSRLLLLLLLCLLFLLCPPAQSLHVKVLQATITLQFWVDKGDWEGSRISTLDGYRKPLRQEHGLPGVFYYRADVSRPGQPPAADSSRQERTRDCWLDPLDFISLLAAALSAAAPAVSVLLAAIVVVIIIIISVITVGLQ